MDPNRHVGVFPPGLLEQLLHQRKLHLERFSWLLGEWDHQNLVPATSANPAYCDTGTSSYSASNDGMWILGKGQPFLTYDPFSKRYIFVLTRGSFGVLRSTRDWDGRTIAFEGSMTMLGIDLDWRMVWFRDADDRFSFRNEERGADGQWALIDEWRFLRSKQSA